MTSLRWMIYGVLAALFLLGVIIRIRRNRP